MKDKTDQITMSLQEGPESKASQLFKCHFSGCTRVFKRQDRLNIHLRVHTGERPFVCSVEGCGKSYARSQHLSRHVEKSHNIKSCDSTTIVCPVCRNEFANAYSLKRHIATVHEEKCGPKGHECPEQDCNQSFHKRKQLVNHRLTEHTDHIIEAKKCHRCPHQGCNKTFTWLNLLKRHMKTHQGYTCTTQECGQVFANWSSLRKHVAHDHAEVHCCKVCGIKFSRKPNLTQHMKRKHIEPKKMFVCPEKDCGRTYKYKTNLALHVRDSHEGEMIWKNRTRRPPAKKKPCKKISLAAKLCGLDDRDGELKVLKTKGNKVPNSTSKSGIETAPSSSSTDENMFSHSLPCITETNANVQQHLLSDTDDNLLLPEETLNNRLASPHNNNYEEQSQLSLEMPCCKSLQKQSIATDQDLAEITVIIEYEDRSEKTVVALKRAVEEASQAKG
ncbi:transcription factor iiia [Plakobranchus ocellatus]|uniref:Transcription factor iiia n=1 Tax=Plakobranchus ocellatus TaxID=259542 RepID=A0AAV4DBU3_9GAST|nr:transcription factor iiia [Plakobranchus ocellatus]